MVLEVRDQNPWGSLFRAYLPNCAYSLCDFWGGDGKWEVYSDKGTTWFLHALFSLHHLKELLKLPMEAKKIKQFIK